MPEDKGYPKGYMEVERDERFIPVKDRINSGHMDMMFEVPECGPDGKCKEVDEYGNTIEHGFLGPRKQEYIW